MYSPFTVIVCSGDEPGPACTYIIFMYTTMVYTADMITLDSKQFTRHVDAAMYSAKPPICHHFVPVEKTTLV